MGRYVLELEDVDRARIAAVGGKGANLGELARIEGVRVPAGFCLTTDAFRRVVEEAPGMAERIHRLSHVSPDDRAAIATQCAEIRRAVEMVGVPLDVAAEVGDALVRHGESAAYAVRSSATAEDLATASFAGQHDTHLNVVGGGAVLSDVRRSWASLYTERAATYRLRNGIEHRSVRMAVVVQRMARAEVSGVLFTADPVSGNRKVARVEAVFGLGEALVSGQAAADAFTVRGGAVVARSIVGERATLTDAQVERLVALGRRIEAHFGRPQDVEWCLADDELSVVQSRPITTLYPIPRAADDANHVYLSVGHQQMMTDAMKPLGISVRQHTAVVPMLEAGGRLFVDATRQLASPARAAFLDMINRSDPLVGDALRVLIERGDFFPPPNESAGAPPAGRAAAAPPPLPSDRAVVAELIAQGETSIAALERDIRGKSGPALLDFILADFAELKRVLFEPRVHQVVMAGMETTVWLNDHLDAWLGEKNAADALSQSVPDNVTSEMGLALLDVADAIRPHAEVIAFLERVKDDDFLAAMPAVKGGREARDAIVAWLDRYGMRGLGEIDITTPRWSERPSALVPILLSHVRNFAAGEAARRFERGLETARTMEREVLARLRTLADGERKAEETKRTIDRLRTFIGYREYPKYAFVRRYFVYRRALLDEAERLVRRGVLREAEDIYFLTLEELRDVVRTLTVDDDLLRRRREEFRANTALTPPRVLTSEGESVAGSYRREDVPAGALVGLAVSAGTVEGRARVVMSMAEADLEPGDILVTPFTDPSWTPVFVTIAGMVTEVGGLMTHGAVIAREYGLPAVVGVENATRLIPDGARIRLHGTAGYVEILE